MEYEIEFCKKNIFNKFIIFIDIDILVYIIILYNIKQQLLRRFKWRWLTNSPPSNHDPFIC